MKTIPVNPYTPNLRLLGRMDLSQRPLCLDWTGTGLEVRLRGSGLWAELEAVATDPIFYVVVLADGCPITRFPVEPGISFYPLIIGMEADKARTITLLKETQCMPDHPEATLCIHSLRYEGELLPLPDYDLRVEFIGDSLTSGEGALAPMGNQEWIPAWFTARGNYSWYACQAINAERRILSQSGYGVCWNYEHDPARVLTTDYELIAGVLSGPRAEDRGCRKAYDFSSWPADIVCIRLATNDAGGMRRRESFLQDGPVLTQGCLDFLRKVRRCNPAAKIVWILPASSCHPEFARAAVEQAQAEGMENVYSFTLPDYQPEDCGAREHPSAEWNRLAGELLGDFLRTLL